jgi:hypothetical protein
LLKGKSAEVDSQLARTAAGPVPLAQANGDRAADLPEFDWEEIRRHDAAGDFWIVFCDGVYDVSIPVAPRS